MNRAIVVGDIHGKYEIVLEALKHLNNCHVIFVGDFLDSFDRKVTDQMFALQMAMGAARKHENCHVIMGNHELQYVDRKMRCSGYEYETQHLFDRSVDPSEFNDYVYFGDVLISHAGVSQGLLDYKDITLEQYLEAGSFLQIGHTRGGRDYIGGLHWCDWWTEFEPTDDVPQVVGHSSFRPEGANKGIVYMGNACNIDCLDRVRQVLVIEDGKFEVCELGDL